VRHAESTEVVDLDRIDACVEEELEVRFRDLDGRTARLPLADPAARADVLARVVEWCQPALRATVRDLEEKGTEIASRDQPRWVEMRALLFEVGIAAALAALVAQPVGWLAAGLFALFRTPVRLRRLLDREAPIRLEPTRPFARLVEGTSAIDLRGATFDAGEWVDGKAVLSDGTTKIEIPLGARAGAFALFAALVTWCGTPDDRAAD